MGCLLPLICTATRSWSSALTGSVTRMWICKRSRYNLYKRPCHHNDACATGNFALLSKLQAISIRKWPCSAWSCGQRTRFGQESRAESRSWAARQNTKHIVQNLRASHTPFSQQSWLAAAPINAFTQGVPTRNGCWLREKQSAPNPLGLFVFCKLND